jgi:CheY-like chemotaxis protein
VYKSVAKSSLNRTDRLLVIDDDSIVRELLPLLLGAAGHTVLVAESGEDALDVLSGLKPGESPTVILTDLVMPDESPYALGVRLRLACPEPTVLLAMSATEPVNGEADAFDGFLLKPFQIADYEAAVARARKLIDERPTSSTRHSSNSLHDTVNETNPEVPALDDAIHTKLSSVMGATQLPQLYTLFLEDANMRVTRMQAAITSNDIGTFTREAHAIKGGCGMLGATELYSLASRMEAGGFACSPLLDDFGPAFERLRRILRRTDESTSRRPHGTENLI